MSHQRKMRPAGVAGARCAAKAIRLRAFGQCVPSLYVGPISGDEGRGTAAHDERAGTPCFYGAHRAIVAEIRQIDRWNKCDTG